MSWERYTNDKETGFEGEIWSGEIFTPRSIACHSLPCRPYQHPFQDGELPEWDWEPQQFLEIIKRVDSLKAMVAPLSELQQRYNDITARGRQTIFEKEIQWLWGDDISSLMKPHDLTERDMLISSKILEHEENERMNRESAKDGKRLDPPDLETPNRFRESQRQLATRGKSDEILREQETRKVWLKVYEELAELYDLTSEQAKPSATSGVSDQQLKRLMKLFPQGWSTAKEIIELDQNMPDLSRAQQAVKLKMSEATLEGWITRLNKEGISIRSRRKRAKG